MSSIQESTKTEEEMEMRVPEEIIEEEVIEEEIPVEQVEWMGPTEVLEQGQAAYYPGEELMEHQIVDYDDTEPYQSFLPVRDGVPYFSLNLPDLLSKTHQFTQGNGPLVRIVSCFNKKCQRQVSCGGYLYTIKDYVSESQWNTWQCVSEGCYGEIRTSPDFREIRASVDHIDENCQPDELQISIRIAVYDTRLLAEFTDTPLENLYMAAVERVKSDCAETLLIFPSFDTLKNTLEDHRLNKIYRKRFEMQNLKDKQKRLNMTPDEVVYTENTSGLIKFRRTKPFPISHCSECSDQFLSTHLPSQDQLVAHYMFNHGQRLTIERFEFKDLNTFDQYMRELNTHSRLKLKRMGLADENMYFLCAHDDRLAKSGVGRASRLQQQNCHCTAFIRIFDWRIVSKKETSRILIDYCLEHQPHPTSATSSGHIPNREYIDYYTPEVFLRDLEDRRHRSQKMMEEGGVDRNPSGKRPLEMKQFLVSARTRPIFGTRSLAPPLAAQIAAGNSHAYVDVFEDQNQPRSARSKYRQSIRTPYPKPHENEQDLGAPDAPEPSEGPSTSEARPPPRIFITQKPYQRLTERQNFKDIYTFNAICKMEDACISLLNRMQTCQNARVGMGYKEKIMTILKHASTDLSLTDGATAEEIEKSWVLQKPVRGRPRKRIRIRGNEEEEVEEAGEEELEEEEPIERKPEIRISPETKPTTSEVSTDSTDSIKRSGRARKVPARLQ